jgi:chromosome segregation ATPase
MSLTNDAVTVFKNTLMSVIHKPEQRALPAPMEPVMVEQTTSPTTVPSLLDQSLLAVARDAADIRRDHDAILTKTATLSTLQEDLHGAFERAYQALEQLAEARSQLAKAEAVARFEHEARENAAQRLSGMTATYHQTVSELEKLRPEAKRLENSLRQTGDRLLQVEIENATLTEQLNEWKAESERRAASEAALRREHEELKTELASTNGYVAQRVSEISQLHERCEIAEQGARTSARALEESRSECASALVRLDEERVKLASAESCATALESQLRDLGEKFSAARASWSQEAEGFNDTVARLRHDLAQATGRVEAHERLLSSAQADVAGLRRQYGELENVLAGSRLNASQLLTRAEAAEAARDLNGVDLASSKRLHQSLMRRVKPLLMALRDKGAESVKLAATLAEMERRFLTYQSEAGDMIRTLQDRETQLVADLEAERARRVVAEGALAIDRSFRPLEIQRRAPEPS